MKTIKKKQTKDNDTALSSVFTSLLYDIKDSIVKQNENTARLSEQLIKQLNNVNLKENSSSTRRSEVDQQGTSYVRANMRGLRASDNMNWRECDTHDQQGTSYVRANMRASDNMNWRARDAQTSDRIKYNNRGPRDANMCYGHFHYGKNTRHCAPWCRFLNEFNSQTDDRAFHSNDTTAKNM